MTVPLPLFSVIVPAHNEEKFLGACLVSIENAGRRVGNRYETIVVLNRCNDRSEEIARAHGAQVVFEQARCLSLIRNAGAKLARGQMIVTIDADSNMSSGMLTAIARLLEEGSYLGGGVRVKMERMSLGIFCTLLMIAPVLLFLRVSGGLFWCRREDFMAIGGFDKSLVSAEDVDFARRLRKYGKERGQRFKTIFREYIVTSCRKWDRFGDWYLVRNPRLVWVILRGHDPKAAAHFYYDVDR